ncbi:MAG TPA: hypothetical protein VHI93_01420 [Candidatus Thermoplasmatota archaeon]|nr:hypothetical protein [Candidatus Thermoplasmatota archaeon]
MRRFGIGRDESVALMGMKGTGKTTLGRVLAHEMGPVLAWDPFGQYGAPIRSYRPPVMDDANDLDRIAAHLFELGRQGHPNTLLVEEAEQVLPEGMPLPRSYKQYALMGRNLGLRTILNTRRPQGVSKMALRNSNDHLFIFKLEGGDIDWLVKVLGKRHAAQLREMETWVKDPRQGGGRFLQYHDGELREHKPLAASMAKR